MDFEFDFSNVRNQFPCFERKFDGRTAVYLDAPGGTQTPKTVVDRMSDYLLYHNSNYGLSYTTSMETTEIMDNARKAMADFLGCSYEEVAFGESTTSNNFRICAALARDMNPGDEVIITDIEHESNRSTWRQLEEQGFIVNSVKVDLETNSLDIEHYKELLSPKTKVVSLNWAANGLGTITDVKKMISMAHEVGALTIIDAVHYAPHGVIDVKDIDTDILLCSTYKFFGPHQGVAYVKEDVLENLRSYRVIAPDNEVGPHKLELGTPSFEGMAGTIAAIEFIADIGKNYVDNIPEVKNLEGNRKNIVAAMIAIEQYEDILAEKLTSGLKAIDKVQVVAPGEGIPKTSTVLFYVEGQQCIDIAKFLNEKAIFVCDGDYYAIKLINDVFGFEDQGGLIRMGFAPYITEEDVDRTIEAVSEYCSKISEITAKCC
jgi:cysteine desulfurase family protein (TIGR01976 family)